MSDGSYYDLRVRVWQITLPRGTYVEFGRLVDVQFSYCDVAIFRIWVTIIRDLSMFSSILLFMSDKWEFKFKKCMAILPESFNNGNKNLIYVYFKH